MKLLLCVVGALLAGAIVPSTAENFRVRVAAIPPTTDTAQAEQDPFLGQTFTMEEEYLGEGLGNVTCTFGSTLPDQEHLYTCQRESQDTSFSVGVGRVADPADGDDYAYYFLRYDCGCTYMGILRSSDSTKIEGTYQCPIEIETCPESGTSGFFTAYPSTGS
ncbi:unnamed protein product [Vitrella brassicaformis CCMP3155]|uniref:Uncharacterized protein n=1 Tax=Vitrella brassicaformis (strain CCMP3155) TaxID=1169540 RepID=A0A0G4FAD6_VITBC|nr:unnamed protein product [Vitrella brassicaformis CCMP3155]|eukprot:CEM09330.1 unnamed protein product [Vitrella brassicaformis CCMP3155]